MQPLTNLEARIEAYLGQLELDAAWRPGGVTAVDAGDSVVLLTCFEQDGATWVRLAAIVRIDVEPTLELLHLLLRLDTELLIGSFRLFEDRTLAFSATLHGHNLDAEALGRTLRYVAAVAATHADALASIAGGSSWAETCSEAPSC